VGCCVGEYRLEMEVDGLNVVDAGLHPGADQELNRNAGASGIGAHVGQCLDAQRKDLAVGVEREFGPGLDVAAMGAREKLFAALGHPLHGALDLQRGKGDGNVLGIGAGLHAETTADVAHHHAYLFLCEANGRADGIAHARGHLRAHANREAVGFAVIRRKHRARLDGQGHDALVDHVERDHMAGPGKGGRRGVAAAVLHFGGDVAGGLLAQLRRSIGGGAREIDHHREFVVIDHHGLGGVARLLDCFGHHRGDRLADEARSLVRHGKTRRTGAVAAIGAFEAGRAGYRLNARFGQFAAGDHAQHAGHGGSGGGVDRHDARMRIGRPEKDEMRLARKRDVVRIAACTGQQALVLEAANRLAAAETRGVGFSGQRRGPLGLAPRKAMPAWRVRYGSVGWEAALYGLWIFLCALRGRTRGPQAAIVCDPLESGHFPSPG
jgi:hypothetical protein